MKKLVFSLIAMIAFALLAVPAGATMQYYTSQSAWAAATSGVYTIDFNDIAVSGNYNDYSITGLHLHNVDFTADVPVDYLWVIRGGTTDDVYNSWGAGNNFLRGSTWGTRYIQAALPEGVFALSMQLLTNVYGGTVTFNFSTGDTYVMSTTNDTSPDFIGFVFDQPVEWVRLDSNQSFAALDNFAYAETPEANTVLLGGIGLVALWVARLLRRYC